MNHLVWGSDYFYKNINDKILLLMPDPITHTCISFVFARHCFSEQKGLFVLAALSPDLDVALGGLYVLLTRPLPPSISDFAQESLIFHPSLTAAIWFLPIYGLLLSWVFRRFNQRAQKAAFGKIYTLVICGMLFHIGLDLMQTGNRLFWPMSWEFGIEIIPYTTAGLVGPMVGSIMLLIADPVVSYLFKRRRNSNNNC